MLRIMGKCVSRHLFLYGGLHFVDYWGFFRILNLITLDFISELREVTLCPPFLTCGSTFAPDQTCFLCGPRRGSYELVPPSYSVYFSKIAESTLSKK